MAMVVVEVLEPISELFEFALVAFAGKSTLLEKEAIFDAVIVCLFSASSPWFDVRSSRKDRNNGGLILPTFEGNVTLEMGTSSGGTGLVPKDDELTFKVFEQRDIVVSPVVVGENPVFGTCHFVFYENRQVNQSWVIL